MTGSYTTRGAKVWKPAAGDGSANGQDWSALVDANFDYLSRAAQYHVDSFGAVGDGVTDSTSAIAAAIAAARASTLGAGFGGTVVFGEGTYIISTMLDVDVESAINGRATINLKGEGHNTSILKWKTGVAAPTAMLKIHGDDTTGGDGHLVEGIGFDGNAIATRGLYLTTISFSTFRRLKFLNFALGSSNEAAIVTANGAGTGCLLNRFERIYFANSRNLGLYLGGSFINGTTIRDCEFADTREGSLKTASGGYISIQDNYFEGLSVDSTYSIHLGAGHGDIIGNKFEDVTTGKEHCRSIYLASGAVDVEIASNRFGLQGQSEYMVELAGSNSDIAIHDNNWVNNATISNVLMTGSSNSNIRVTRERNAAGGSSGYASGGDYLTSVNQSFTSTYAQGFRKLAVNKAYPSDTPGTALDVNGEVWTFGVAAKEKSSAFDDSDVPEIPPAGQMMICGVRTDTSPKRLVVRLRDGNYYHIDLLAGS